MLTPLEEIGIRTAGRVAEEAAVLPLHTILRVSSLLFLGFALFFLIVRLERKARQAFIRATAPKTGHYAFLAGMILILIPVWTGRESGIRGILIPVLITLLFLAAGAGGASGFTSHSSISGQRFLGRSFRHWRLRKRTAFPCPCILPPG